MSEHIDFIDNVYDNVKNPLGFICNKVGGFMGSSQNYSLTDKKDEDEDLDERRARGRKTAASAQGRHDDERARLPEAKIREILKKAIQIVNENKAKKD